MNVKKITIKNILGISEMEFTPGKFNEITGRNGTGKTSVLESIKAALKGGHDATLLRNGADQGEIVLVFDNDTVIRKRVTPSSSDLTVKQNGKASTKPVAILDALRDIVSVNPVEFIHADAKRRLEILLQALTFDLTDQQLSDAAGFDCKVVGNPLECIGAVRKDLFNERTGINRAEKEKRATLNELSDAIPANVSADPTEEIAKWQGVVSSAESIRDEAIAERDARKQEALWQAQAVRDSLIQAARDTFDEEQAQILLDYNASVEASRTTCANQTGQAKEKIATLQEQLKQKGRYEQQRDIIKKMEAEVEDLAQQATEKTQALERIDALKDSLLADLPFNGLTISEGEILLNGISFDRINSSDQVRFVMQLAALKAGEIGLICVDGLELIDAERYEKFKDVAVNMDVQFFVTRVSSEDFAVNSVSPDPDLVQM